MSKAEKTKMVVKATRAQPVEIVRVELRGLPLTECSELPVIVEIREEILSTLQKFFYGKLNFLDARSKLGSLKSRATMAGYHARCIFDLACDGLVECDVAERETIAAFRDKLQREARL